MSFLGPQTKKVTAYGRKRTAIIAVHEDFTPIKENIPPQGIAQPETSPIAAKRQPLVAKPPSEGPNAAPAQRPLIESLKAAGSESCSKESTFGASIEGKQKAVEASTATEKEKGDEPRRGWGHSRSSRSLLVVQRTPVKRVGIPVATSPSAKSNRSPRKTGKKRRQPVVEIRISAKPPAPQQPTAPSVHTVDELAQKLGRIDLAGATQQTAATIASHDLSPPTKAFSRLLSACTATDVISLDDLFYSSDFRFLFPHKRGDHTIRKIGEATYSEVFAVGVGGQEVVVKIIPLFDGRTFDWDAEKHDGRDFPDRSDAEDVMRELEVTRRMSKLPGGGFIEYRGAFVSRGVYSDELLDSWDEYKATAGSASARPDCFDALQQYLVLVLSDGGSDLENFKFHSTRGWEQAAGVFWQVADALSRAEDWARFEHRDMHEGQILIAPVPYDVDEEGANLLSPSIAGVKAIVIDFGLSRLDQPFTFEPIYAQIPVEIYEGVGTQWDVYRAMRDVVREKWEGFHPITNVMWLQYILRVMLHRTKSLKKPVTPGPLRPARKGASTRTRVKPEQPTDAALRAHTMLCQIDESLSACLKGKKEALRLESAVDVADWGRTMGWIV